MGRLYAGILGPVAFTTILARSLIDAGVAQTTLKTATCFLFAFAGIGYVVGKIAEFIVSDSVRARFQQELRKHESAATGRG